MQKQIFFTVSILIVLLSSLFSGCSEISDYSSAADNSVTETRTISTSIEILWVIDNSGSMQTKQSQVASAFSSFSGLFLQKGYHFRMAIITTDAYMGNNRQVFRANCGSAILDENTTDLNTCFSTNIQQGTAGSGTECALNSIITAIESPVNSAYNFPAENSFLRLIIIGDEDDSSVLSGTTLQTVEYFHNYFESRYDTKAFSVSTPLGLGLFGEGIRIRQFVDGLSGLNFDIRATDFSDYLSTFATAIARDTTSIVLSRNPAPGTLTVTIDTIPVSEDTINGWSYDTGTRTIYFNGTSLPAENSIIMIKYTPE